MCKFMLNDSQIEVVNSLEGIVLVLAGPGSGKTKTIVDRTINMIRKGVKAENIFLSTFTNKASNEIKLRITEELEKNNLKINVEEIYLGTLHSNFLRLMEEYLEYSRFSKGYRVFDDTEQHFFVLSNMKYFNKIPNINTIMTKLSSWERSRELINWFNKINDTNIEISSIISEDRAFLALKEAYNIYIELLIKNNSIDFSTIQKEFYRLLISNPEVLEKISEKIKYITIDEFQDTNKIQNEIINLLGKKYQNICVVGDDDQSIYRFRGANVTNILNFPKKYKDRCKVINLNINYRSHKDIILFCNRWINRLKWGECRKEKEAVPPENKIFFDTAGIIRVTGEVESRFYENIYLFLRQLIGTKKITNYNQVVFLFKSLQTPTVINLKKYLINKGIPVYSPRSKNFFQREDIKIIIATLLVFYPQSEEFLRKDEKIAKFYQECLEILKRYLREDTEFYKWIVERRKENKSEDKREFLNFKELIYQVLQFKTIRDKFFLEDEYPLYNLGIFTEIIEKYENLTKIDEINAENIEIYLKYFFMTYMKNLYFKKIDEYEDEEKNSDNKVAFYTFHQAKGLEFPIVFVGSLDETPNNFIQEHYLDKILNINDYFEPENKVPYFDFWRLYYTAFSRAKNLLVLISKDNDIQSSSVFSSYFESVPKFNSNEFSLAKVEIEKIEKKDKIESFSYTDIEKYSFCPFKYKMLNIIKLKGIKNTESFFGSVVHEIIEVINKNRGKVDVFQVIQKGIALFERRNLHKFTVEEIKKIEIIAKKYFENFDFLNIKECEFKIYHLEENFIFNGTIDMILEIQGKYIVIDFKTGIYNEEKIEEYRKQLEFYIYLVKNNFSCENVVGELYFLDEEILKIRLEIEKKDIEKRVFYAKKIVNKILSKDFYRKNYDIYCEKCEFRWYCEKKELEDENTSLC